MTENTKKRLPGIIERIDELRDEVDRIHDAEVGELRAKCKKMDRMDLIDAIREIRQLYGVCASLGDAANILANF